MSQYAESYQGYTTSFRPLALANGKFVARAVVTEHRGAYARDNVLDLAGEMEFDTEEEAADFARVAARKWIDANP